MPKKISLSDTALSEKRKLIKAMYGVLRGFAQEERGLTSGIGREIRTKALGGGEDGVSVPGNSANAALAATARAGTALRSRRTHYQQGGVPETLVPIVHLARVTAVNPLLPMQWVLVAAHNQPAIYVGKVLTLYTKGAGKQGKHGAVVDAGVTNIAAVSNIAVQLYSFAEQTGLFSRITENLDLLNCGTFALWPSIQLLCKVGSPTVATSGDALKLLDSDFTVFSQLRTSSDAILKGIQISRKRQRSVIDDD
ncbi:hypothetical protein GGX14DRAFT_407899 [Mycena pura]|uniref:Uncharacterized protein n=1 Tax=Mycena pura TaxID=153505 RepID=A0AAD6XWM1_9AGAR|nr:hypothetical protein GGX14DRAFT_407899 [Mycena pura]